MKAKKVIKKLKIMARECKKWEYCRDCKYNKMCEHFEIVPEDIVEFMQFIGRTVKQDEKSEIGGEE